MTVRVPTRLDRDPIMEAIFEVRFRGPGPVAEVLPGMLYSSLQEQFPEISSLPVAEIPRAARLANHDLLYQPVSRLEGDRMALGVGERVVTLSKYLPYKGWDEFKSLVLHVVKSLQDTGRAKTVERIALKYINLITIGADSADLSTLRVKFEAEEFDFVPGASYMRFEVKDKRAEDTVSIVEINPGMNVRTAIGDSFEPRTGVLLTVDTIRTLDADRDFFGDVGSLLETLHGSEKEMFFGLLTPDAIEKMGPTWSKK